MSDVDALIRTLPDPAAAERFFARLRQERPAEIQKLVKNEGLLSDVLTLVAYSPLLAATLLQNPQYFAWVNKRRAETKVRNKEELLEALARFTLTNSSLETNVLLSRFQRRELLRIYLRDIRNLGTISEITEELSHLADAVLEHALRVARQELDNRYGAPQVKDEKGRDTAGKFTVISLGKLGSRELNYASDIDLLFLYSEDGTTSGAGSRGALSNKEYFIKLSELVTKLVGQQAGEGAAYRVDLRLRPHGRIGPLAVSLKEAVDYYHASARNWERQVLLRARGSAGDADLFRDFYRQVEDVIYQTNVSLAEALETVRISKLQIDMEHKQERGFNVKLGRGGIREIEFIAQAPQLALGDGDHWLRAPHTLISLSRLADRHFLRKRELTQLSDAYSFLRALEHRVQMENGLQTHAVPEEAEKKELTARRMNYADAAAFAAGLKFHTDNVSEVYQRIFSGAKSSGDVNEENRVHTSYADGDVIRETDGGMESVPVAEHDIHSRNFYRVRDSWEKFSPGTPLPENKLSLLHRICEASDAFSEMIAANPDLINTLDGDDEAIDIEKFAYAVAAEIERLDSFREEIDRLRTEWSKVFLRIGIADLLGSTSMREVNLRQTELAEASMRAALAIVEKELRRRYRNLAHSPAMTVLALGRMGGRGMDYGSDLDLVLVYDDEVASPAATVTHAEFYQAAAEIFVTVLSSFTRHGNLYRVDLRLRPDGKNGPLCCARSFFIDYLENRAAIWEWLAYVKLRAVAGPAEFSAALEQQAKSIIHRRAEQTEDAELKAETFRVRQRLEEQKAKKIRNNEIDIKYSTGGLLDIYFLIRYLQLKNNVPDEDGRRSTPLMLETLFSRGLLERECFDALSEGYTFLRAADHATRLIAGKASRLPGAGHPTLRRIAHLSGSRTPEEMVQNLTAHRIAIRQCFDDLLQ